MSANVRMATIDDIDKLIKVRFDYFAVENWEVSSEQHKIIEDNLRRYILKYINTDFFAAIIEENNKIASVAFLSISNKPANPFFPSGRTGTILNVLTYPEFRKKGYASSILNCLIEQAKMQNLSFIELSASESGKRLYQKLGFIETSHSQRFIDMRLSLIVDPFRSTGLLY